LTVNSVEVAFVVKITSFTACDMCDILCYPYDLVPCDAMICNMSLPCVSRSVGINPFLIYFSLSFCLISLISLSDSSLDLFTFSPIFF
jgi:hypothetical protein